MSPTILNGQSSAGAAKLIHASHVTRERGQQPKYVIGRNRMAQHRRLPRRHRWCSRVRPWWRWTPKSQRLRRKVGAGSVQTQRMFSVVACVAYLYITRSYYCRIQRTINVLLSHIACGRLCACQLTLATAIVLRPRCLLLRFLSGQPAGTLLIFDATDYVKAMR